MWHTDSRPTRSERNLRPEAKISASPVEGVPPLTVTFRSETDAVVAWEFGDGTTSTQNPATHNFEQPGLYTVTLRVTDRDGGSAANQVQIAVDRDTEEAIVRAGFADGETPTLTLKGTAKRGPDGTIQLPDGQPWGWVKAGDGVLEDLRALRSFHHSGVGQTGQSADRLGRQPDPLLPE